MTLYTIIIIGLYNKSIYESSYEPLLDLIKKLKHIKTICVNKHISLGKFLLFIIYKQTIVGRIEYVQNFIKLLCS